ncbi:calcium-binding protein [Mycobacterium triplex]|uniref:Calcium-binding protein n=1 Tax=Mycobacterium triplex TaxID=47839 RepID=A0A024K2W1_9MYCO|nr:cytochrome P450 [Mycobacterium triplex]ORW99960.1 calcium-binding protein [Mycobacterium triplex]CDO90216.1 cytochrome P450 superfamily protein [Mycobacterium triplex]
MTSSAVERDAAALLPTFDLFDPEHENWKYDAFAYARRHCPVVRVETELTGPMWMVTRYADVRKVLEDPETFSSRGGSPAPTPIGLGPLDSDPPLHTGFRKLLNPYLSRKYSLTFETEMRSIARELIDGFIDNGKVELLGEFAGPFVSRVLASVVFKETDMAKMERAKEVVFAVTEDGTEQAFINLGMLAAEYLAAATENPPAEEGILRSLVTGTVDGKPLDPQEALGAICVLFLGGLDTTRSAIGTIAMNIALQPELEARVRDPRWVRNDMDEFIRHASPVATFGRTVTRDTEVGGCPMRKGDRVLVRFDSANRDEEKFPDADRLQFDPPRGGNAGFGLGIHRCVGMHLARVEITIAFEELLARITNLKFDGDPADLKWAPGIANCPDRVPLIFEKV